MQIAQLRVPPLLPQLDWGPLLTSKLRPPAPRGEYVDRPRLLAALDGDRQDTVTLVVGPAGYGKTTLLAQWAAQSTQPVAWLALSSSESHLGTFTAYVIGAIREIDPGLTRLNPMDPRLRTATPAQLATMLLNDIAEAEGPFSLVIDDYHVIDDSGVHALVIALLEHMPENLHLIISSRHEPPFPLARLRVLGKLRVIGIDELRFTPAESAAFFAGLGIALKERDVDTLHERTAGWIAGLKMAALSLAEGATSDETFLQRMKTSSRLLQDFLLEEVLWRQPPEVQGFLLRTALFDRFSADLYQAITGQPGMPLLERVLRANLFVTPLDQQAIWFHYHHLFREFLRARAAVELDETARLEIFRRASAWFEQQGMTGEGVTAAITGRDWNHAASMIRPIVDAAMQREDLGQLANWFRALPPGLLDADPDLVSRYAWCLVRIGDLAEAEQAIARAERVAEAQGDLLSLASATIAGAQRSRFADDPISVIRQVERGADLLTQLANQHQPEDDATADSALSQSHVFHVMNALARVLRASGLRLLGHAEEAERVVVAAREFAGRLDTPYQFQGTTVELGRVLIQVGRLADAYDLLQEAAATTTIYPSDRRLAMLSLAEVDLEGNRLDEAQRALDESRASLERSVVRVWLPHLQYLQAQVEWARGEFDAAIKSTQEAERAAAESGNQRIARDAAALLAQIELAQGHFGTAYKWAYDAHLAPDDPADYARLREHLVYARVLMAQDEVEDAIGLLERLLVAADTDGRVADVITILVSLALGYQELFELDKAVAALDRALALAEARGFLRTFTREGLPMVRLLKVAQRRGTSGATAAHIQRLLTAMGETPAETAKLFHPDLIEGVTPREMEVLRLIAVGLSNREIADELYISVSTVKRHVTNLYGKLGVSTRTAAVQKARHLGLLARPKGSTTVDGAMLADPR